MSFVRLQRGHVEPGSVVLSKEAALELIPPQLEAIGTAAHKSVRYENTPIHTDIMFNFDELFGDLDALAERIATRHLDKLFLTKNTEWESEREYRFVVRSPNEYEYVDMGSALVAAVRGPESAPDAEHSLRHFARELEIALGHVRWDHNDPMLIGRSIE